MCVSMCAVFEICVIFLIIVDTAGADYGDTSSIRHDAQPAVSICPLYAAVDGFASVCLLKILPAVIKTAVCIHSMHCCQYVTSLSALYNPSVSCGSDELLLVAFRDYWMPRLN